MTLKPQPHQTGVTVSQPTHVHNEHMNTHTHNSQTWNTMHVYIFGIVLQTATATTTAAASMNMDAIGACARQHTHTHCLAARLEALLRWTYECIYILYIRMGTFADNSIPTTKTGSKSVPCIVTYVKKILIQRQSCRLVFTRRIRIDNRVSISARLQIIITINHGSAHSMDA